MIVCVCNSLCSKDLACAISDGITSSCEFYSKAGCQKQCGKCAEFVEEAIDRAQFTSAMNSNVLQTGQSLVY